MQQEFDFHASRRARDEGINRVLENTPEYWRFKLTVAFWALVESDEPFTAEDARPICGSPPNHPNAFGAVWHVLSARALKEGWVEVIGHTLAQRKSAHARLLPIYKHSNNGR